MKQTFIKIKKIFYLVVGTISLITGIIGIFLPLLPTTCFLLLTAVCYERGSDKFHDWLLKHPHFGPPILDWQKNKVIRLKYKFMATIMIAISSYFVYPNPKIPSYAIISYTIIIVSVLVFIWTRKSYATLVSQDSKLS